MSYQYIVAADYGSGLNRSASIDSTPIGVWEVVFAAAGNTDLMPITRLVLARHARDAITVSEVAIPQQNSMYGWQPISVKRMNADNPLIAAPDVQLMSQEEFANDLGL